MMCGGFTDYKPMEPEVKDLTMSCKAQIEAKMNATYTTFEPEKFKTQVVAGTNYMVIIKVDGDKQIEAKIFKPLPCNGTELKVNSVTAL
ncbi:MAG: cystatin domain-containing protein [archaeon]|nr:cystatin domain-containing protein [archaeon]